MKVQFVTALYDLATLEKNNARRSLQWYLEKIDFLLHQTVPLIIYTDLHLVDKLKERCAQNPNIQIIGKAFRDLRYADRLSQIEANLTLHPYKSQVPEKMTPVFFVTVWNKAEFLYETYCQQPDTDLLVWIDFGIRHVGVAYDDNLNLEQVYPHLSPHHFSCTIINPMNREEYHDLFLSCSYWQYRQAGGFWSVGRPVMQLFIDTLRTDTETILQAGYACMEEDLMARFVFAHPEKCCFMFGDDQSCISNWIDMKHDLTIAHRIVLVGGAMQLDHIVAACIPFMLQNVCRGLILCDIAHVFRYLCQWYTSLSRIQSHLAVSVGHFILLCSTLHPQFLQILQRHKDEFEQFECTVNDQYNPSQVLNQHMVFPGLKTYVENKSSTVDKHPFIRFLA